jgi:hypothetical protein
MRTVVLVVLYLGPALAAVAAAAWVGSPVPRRTMTLFLILPLAFVFAGFFSGRTILPVDHARLIPPWSGAAPGAVRYNANLNDAITQFAPWAKAVRVAWREGSLPFRDRWNGCGTPLAANGQSAAFAPWTLLTFLVPLASGFTLLAAWKVFFALTGTWLWLKALGVGDVPAEFGATAFGLSFTMTPWLLFPQTSAIALFPWILFAIERLRDRASFGRALVLLTALLTVWPLAGHVESVASFALFAALWLTVRVAIGDYPRQARIWGAIAFSAALALALSAFALLPQALAILASNRLVLARRPFWASVFSWVPHRAVWPGIPLTLFPRSLGDAIGAPMMERAQGSSFSEMGLGHFGVIGAGCALLFLRPGSRRPRSEMALLVPLVFGLLAGIGLWPFAEVAGLLPGLKMMFPLRWLSWVALAGAAVASFELDRLLRDGPRPAGLAWLLGNFGLIAALAVLWFAANRAAYESAGAIEPQKRALALSLLIVAAGFVAAVASMASRPARRGLPLLLTAILAAELFWQGRRLYRFGTAAELFPETPLLSFLRSRPAPFRVVGEGAALFPGSNVFAGLEDVRTHDPVERADYVRFLDSCCGYDPGAYFKQVRDVNAAALDLLNVRFLVSVPGRSTPGPRWKLVYSGRDGTVFENPQARPRVFPADPSESLAISSYRERTNRAEVAFVSDASRPVALRTSLVDDGGWTVRDASGRLLEKSAADAPFLGFVLPAGQKLATFSYSPPGFFGGSAISLSALAALLVWAISRRIRGRRSAPPSPLQPKRR